jgi:hypothetical protein
MHRVEHDHIRNENIRDLFGVVNMHDQLQIQTSCWLGQLARQPDVTANKGLLSVRSETLGCSGTQKTDVRATYAET